MTRISKQRGVSLLEALVAIVVMSIGAVAVVGMQASLRLNGDVAKQRSLGVRLAQQQLEDWRGYTGFAIDAGAIDWVDIANASGIITPANSNAQYTRTLTVVPSGESDDNPRSKTVHVRVAWTDRANVEQSVALNTIITGAHPELGGSLSVPMSNSLLSNPGGRHPDIPRAAVPFGVDTSSFNPPGSPATLAWVFNNTSGLVTQTCTDVADATSCTDVNAMLLAGFVRFSTGLTQPSPTQAEAPSSPAQAITVTVDQELPFDTDVPCFVSLVDTTSTAYFCLVHVNPPVFPKWTGITKFSGISLASDIDDDEDDEFKVCRYTTVRDNSSAAQANVKNVNHPLKYVEVDASLTNQNYLVIRAGDDSNSFSCPNDNTSTPNVNGATWHHQPND